MLPIWVNKWQRTKSAAVHCVALLPSGNLRRRQIPFIQWGKESINVFDTGKTWGKHKIKFLLYFLHQNKILNGAHILMQIQSMRKKLFSSHTVENAFLCMNQTQNSYNKRIISFNT